MMRIQGRFLKDSGLTFAGRVASRALYLLQALLLARWLGPELNGRYAFAFSLMMLASSIAKFGLDTLLVRETARQPEQAARLLAHALRIHAVLGLLALLGMLAVCGVSGKPMEVTLLAAGFGVSMGLNCLALSRNSVLAALGRFDLQALSETLLYGLQLIGALAAVHCGFGLVGVGIASAGMSIVSLALGWRLGWSRIGPLPREWSPELARSLISMAWPLALTGVAIGVYYRIDSLFLSFLWTDREVGHYDAAYNFIHGLRQIPAAISMAAFPALARLAGHDRDATARATSSFLRTGLLIGVPLVVGCYALARPMVLLVYKPEYLPSVAPLRVLLWTIPLMLCDAVQSYLLVALGRQRRLLAVTSLGAAVNLTLNAALIPAYGMMGAAVATVASEAVVMAAMQASVAEFFAWPDFWKAVRWPLLVSSAAVALLP